MIYWAILGIVLIPLAFCVVVLIFAMFAGRLADRMHP